MVLCMPRLLSREGRNVRSNSNFQTFFEEFIFLFTVDVGIPTGAIQMYIQNLCTEKQRAFRFEPNSLGDTA